MNALPKAIPSGMTVEDFLAWPGDGSDRTFQLVDGEGRAMAPATPTHGTIQMTLGLLLESHLRATRSECRAVIAPGIIPRIRAGANVRIADVGVTCVADDPSYRTMPDPVVLIEVLSPSNAAETWENVWAYTTIPSLREILVIHSVRIAAELLLRQPDGAWPEGPEVLDAEGILTLGSVGFSCPLRDVYARTHLGRAAPRPASR